MDAIFEGHPVYPIYFDYKDVLNSMFIEIWEIS